MNISDIDRERQMDIDREEMRKIDRIFTVTFYICAVFPAIPLIFSLCSFVATMITLGVAGMDPLTVLSSILTNGGLIAAYLWSYLKDKRGTIAAIAAVILWWLLYERADSEWLIFVALVTVLQTVCLLQYKKIGYLKTHEGYPDFCLYRKDGVKRIMSDEQIRERMKAPSADMDTLETDGISLKENKENHTSNSYMDELVFNEKEQNK